MAIGISLLFSVPAVAIRSTDATAAGGLYAAYWKGSFFGSPAPTFPACPDSSTPVPSPPAGIPSSTPPTVTETDPNINFGAPTGFYWMESNSTSTPGFPGGFAVTQGGYGVARFSWGDHSLYSDYPTSTYFVNTDFSVEWTGYITLTAGTTYYFFLASDDGSALYINPTPGSSTISGSNIVVNNWFEEPPTNSTVGSFTPSGTSGTQYKYAIEVDYFETCDSQSGIDLYWVSPTGAPSIVPSYVFTPAAIASNGPIVTKGVPQFGLAVPAVAAFTLLAFALTRRMTLGRLRPKA